MCAWAGETKTFRATDPSCHDRPGRAHSVFLSTDPAFCGILQPGLLRLTWSQTLCPTPSPPIPEPLGSLQELGPGGRIHRHSAPAPGAWIGWEIRIGTPGKGHGWPSSGWECRGTKVVVTAAFSSGVHAGAGWGGSSGEQSEGTSLIISSQLLVDIHRGHLSHPPWRWSVSVWPAEESGRW